MQSRAVRDPAFSEVLRECQNRVASMALIHDKLYRASDLARVSFGEYVRDLTNNILTSYALPARSVRVRLDIDDLSLSLDHAVPCGLILNELMSNCLKHAFPVGHSGTISVGFHAEGEEELCLVVRDDGVGVPADVDLGRTSSLGWRPGPSPGRAARRRRPVSDRRWDLGRDSIRSPRRTDGPSIRGQRGSPHAQV